jgi:hypothetical protein
VSGVFNLGDNSDGSLLLLKYYICGGQRTAAPDLNAIYKVTVD